MKMMKILLMLVCIVFFSSFSFVVKAKDCSHLKELHKKLICKSGSDMYDSDTNITSSDINKTSDETKKVKKKGILKTLKEKKEKFEALNKEYDSLADILKKEKK